MDRCALFVDAGYLLADGAMAVHGTRNRDSVSWDYPGLVQFLNEVARDRTGLSLLRCYWYEAVAEEGHSPEQEGIADIPGIKFRAAKIRPGRREGVDSYVQRDLTTLARTGVLCDAVLISGDEDMAPVVADVQDMGHGPYTIFKQGEALRAGLMEIQPQMGAVPPHWLGYVAVRDIEATVKKARELGGSIRVPPMDIPGVGRFSVIQDAPGAVFAAIRLSQGC